MTELLQENYASLKRQYFSESTAPKAAKRIDVANTAAKREALSDLLRHHDEEDISDRETWERDEVDELLHFYSIMEIAALLRLIPSPLPADLSKMAWNHLRQPAVNKYFVTNYPLILPQLFLLRVAGMVAIHEMSDEASFSEFVQLLQLDSMIHGGDEDVDTFLWFLDGGEIERSDIETTIKKFTSAKKFFRSLTKRRRKMNIADSSVRGCVIFLNFCRELDSFLASREVGALLRYESWHLYGYWFGNFQSMVGPHLSDIIDRVAKWKTRQDGQRKKEGEKSVGNLRNTIDRLLSGVYGQLPTLGEIASRERPEPDSPKSRGEKKAERPLVQQIGAQSQEIPGKKHKKLKHAGRSRLATT